MGESSIKCALTMMNISEGDFCHGFYITTKKPFRVLGYAYGERDYNEKIKNGQAYFAEGAKHFVPLSIMLHKDAFQFLNEMNLDDVQLEHQIDKDPIIPQEAFDCLVKLLKINGFIFQMHDLIYCNYQPYLRSPNYKLQLQELLAIYEGNDNFYDSDEEAIITCEMSGIPIFLGETFYKLSFLRKGTGCNLLRIRRCRYKNEDEYEVLDDIRSMHALDADFSDSLLNEKTTYLDYYTINICLDIYDYIKKNVLNSRVLYTFLSNECHFYMRKSFGKQPINECDLYVVFEPATATPLILGPKSSYFMFFRDKYSIVQVEDLITSSKPKKIKMILEHLFYEGLCNTWVVNPYTGLCFYTTKGQLKKKPKEFFKCKLHALKDFLSNKMEESYWTTHHFDTHSFSTCEIYKPEELIKV